MRIHRVVMAAGMALLTGGTIVSNPAVAGATFSGAGNGNVAFIAICDGVNIGQAVYSLNPNGSPPPTYSCPGGTAPTYTQSTAGAADAMPFFSHDGATLYFASNRGNGTTTPWAIYRVAYPPTVSGTAGSQTDGTVALTTPSGQNDYAPTVSADGSELSFIRCDAANSTCKLYTQSPPSGGVPTLVATSVNVRPPDAVSGSADRPEIDPVDNSEIIYVGTDNHIHLVSLTAAFSERDLSQESGVGTAADEYPDWNGPGTKVVLDSTRASGGPAGHSIWAITVSPSPATAASLWGVNDPGTEIEPVYAPATASLVWTKLGSGSNIVEYSPNSSINNAFSVVNLTKNKTNNSQPAWQPVPLGAALPEAPYALLLPAGGLAVILAGIALGRRRARTALPT